MSKNKFIIKPLKKTEEKKEPLPGIPWLSGEAPRPTKPKNALDLFLDNKWLDIQYNKRRNELIEKDENPTIKLQEIQKLENTAKNESPDVQKKIKEQLLNADFQSQYIMRSGEPEMQKKRVYRGPQVGFTDEVVEVPRFQELSDEELEYLVELENVKSEFEKIYRKKLETAQPIKEPDREVNDRLSGTGYTIPGKEISAEDIARDEALKELENTGFISSKAYNALGTFFDGVIPIGKRDPRREIEYSLQASPLERFFVGGVGTLLGYGGASTILKAPQTFAKVTRGVETTLSGVKKVEKLGKIGEKVVKIGDKVDPVKARKIADISGRAAQSAQTFTSYSALDMIGEDVPVAEKADKILKSAFLGLGLGSAGTIGNPKIRIPTEGLVGFTTGILETGDPKEATINALMFMGFGLLNRKNLQKTESRILWDRLAKDTLFYYKKEIKALKTKAERQEARKFVIEQLKKYRTKNWYNVDQMRKDIDVVKNQILYGLQKLSARRATGEAIRKQTAQEATRAREPQVKKLKESVEVPVEGEIPSISRDNLVKMSLNDQRKNLQKLGYSETQVINLGKEDRLEIIANSIKPVNFYKDGEPELEEIKPVQLEGKEPEVEEIKPKVPVKVIRDKMREQLFGKDDTKEPVVEKVEPEIEIPPVDKKIYKEGLESGEGEVYYQVNEKGDIIAKAEVFRPDVTASGKYQIDNVFVTEEYQRQGLASGILKKIAKDLDLNSDNISFGMQSDEGASLVKSFKKQLKPKPKLKTKKKPKLETKKTEIAPKTKSESQEETIERLGFAKGFGDERTTENITIILENLNKKELQEYSNKKDIKTKSIDSKKVLINKIIDYYKEAQPVEYPYEKREPGEKLYSEMEYSESREFMGELLTGDKNWNFNKYGKDEDGEDRPGILPYTKRFPKESSLEEVKKIVSVGDKIVRNMHGGNYKVVRIAEEDGQVKIYSKYETKTIKFEGRKYQEPDNTLIARYAIAKDGKLYDNHQDNANYTEFHFEHLSVIKPNNKLYKKDDIYTDDLKDNMDSYVLFSEVDPSISFKERDGKNNLHHLSPKNRYIIQVRKGDGKWNDIPIEYINHKDAEVAAIKYAKGIKPIPESVKIKDDKKLKTKEKPKLETKKKVSPKKQQLLDTYPMNPKMMGDVNWHDKNFTEKRQALIDKFPNKEADIMKMLPDKGTNPDAIVPMLIEQSKDVTSKEWNQNIQEGIANNDIEIRNGKPVWIETDEVVDNNIMPTGELIDKSGNVIEPGGKKDIISNVIVGTIPKQEFVDAPKKLDVVDINPKDIKMDESKFQPREQYNQSIIDDIAKNYDPAKWEEPVLWKDDTGDMYVVSGHHRIKGAVEGGISEVPVKVLPEGTTLEQARDYAGESNVTRTQQSDFENAAEVRRRLDRGDKALDIANIMPGMFPKAKTDASKKSAINNLANLSYLDSNGKLKQNYESTNEFPRIVSISKFVGGLRKKHDFLTDRHEDDIFTHLYTENAIKGDVDDFYRKIDNIIERMESLDDKPASILKELRKEPQKVNEDAATEIKDKAKELEKHIDNLKRQLDDRRIMDDLTTDRIVAIDKKKYANEEKTAREYDKKWKKESNWFENLYRLTSKELYYTQRGEASITSQPGAIDYFELNDKHLDSIKKAIKDGRNFRSDVHNEFQQKAEIPFELVKSEAFETRPYIEYYQETVAIVKEQIKQARQELKNIIESSNKDDENQTSIFESMKQYNIFGGVDRVKTLDTRQKAELETIYDELIQINKERELLEKQNKAKQINALSYNKQVKDLLSRQTEAEKRKDAIIKDTPQKEDNQLTFLEKDYRGIHQAPTYETGVKNSGNDFGDIYPDDIYSINGARYYGSGYSYDNVAISIMREMKGNPEADVIIYRAVPKLMSINDEIAELESQLKQYLRRERIPKRTKFKTLDGNEWYEQTSNKIDSLKKRKDRDIEPEKIKINSGDWVTISKPYAIEHGKRHLGNYKILQKKVKAKEIFTEGNDIHEWGYQPSKEHILPKEETPAFKNWFKKSKIVDSNGKPLVVYHGTTQNFDKFRQNIDRSGFGEPGQEIYLTDDPKYASRYATLARENTYPKGAMGKVKKDWSKIPSGANVLPVYVSMQNPKLIINKGTNIYYSKEQITKMKKEGYDGVILFRKSSLDKLQFPEEFGKVMEGKQSPPPNSFEEIIVFEPTQIKSAIGNRGTFDPSDASIIRDNSERFPNFTDIKKPFRENATPEQKDLTIQLRKELSEPNPRGTGDSGAWSGLGSGYTIRGNAITKPLREKGFIDLVGTKVKTSHDLAMAAQVLRDPRYETLRIFYIKDNKVVFQNAVTNRLPGAVMGLDDVSGKDLSAVIREGMSNTKADGYYMMHNHPTGSPEPSKADLKYTSIQDKEVKGFLGHIIIDSGSYATITKSPEAKGLRVKQIEFDAYPDDKLLKPSIEHKWLGKEIYNTADLAPVARGLEQNGFFTLIGLDGYNRIRGVVDVPYEFFNDKVHKMQKTLKEISANIGSMKMISIVDADSGISPWHLTTLNKLNVSDSLTDIIVKQNGKLNSYADHSPRALTFGEKGSTLVAEKKKIDNPRRKALARAHILENEIGLTDDERRTYKKVITGYNSLGEASDTEIASYIDWLLKRKYGSKPIRQISAPKKKTLKELAAERKQEIDEDRETIMQRASKVLKKPIDGLGLYWVYNRQSMQRTLEKMGDGGNALLKMFKEADYYHSSKVKPSEVQMEKLWKKVPSDEKEIMKKIIESNGASDLSDGGQAFLRFWKDTTNDIYAEGKKYINEELNFIENYFPLSLKPEIYNDMSPQHPRWDEIVDHVQRVISGRVSQGDVFSGYSVSKEETEKYIIDFLDNYRKQGLRQHFIQQVFEPTGKFKHSYPLELHRDRIFPEWAYVNDVMDIAHAYIDKSYEAIGYAKEFGKMDEEYKYENIDKELEVISADGYDHKLAANIMGWSMGLKRQDIYDETFNKVARSSTTFLLTPRTTLKNLTDLGKAFSQSGTRNTLYTLARLYVPFARSKKDRQLAHDLIGSKYVFAQSLEKTGIGAKAASFYADNIILFTRSERAVRETIGFSRILQAEQLLKNYDPSATGMMQNHIKRLFNVVTDGLDIDVVKARGYFTRNEKFRIGNNAISQTQPTSTIDKPYNWASKGFWTRKSIFQSFSHRSIRWLKDFILEETKRGNMFPMVNLILWRLALGYGYKEASDWLWNKEPEEEETKMKKAFGIMLETGEIGIIGDLLFAVQHSGWANPFISILFGPKYSLMFETLMNFGQTVNRAINDKENPLRPIKRQAARMTIKRIPFVGQKMYDENFGRKKKKLKTKKAPKERSKGRQAVYN